jgi:uncharacterized membrane protein
MDRLFKNLATGRWHLAKALSSVERALITDAVQEAETTTSAQIKVVVEASLHSMDIIRGQTARDRALEVFGSERVWDTTHNNGILLYLLLAERDAEIVADRGFNGKVSPHEWQEVCRVLEVEAKRTGLANAIISAVAQIGEMARKVFPSTGHDNELGDDVRVV